jgi:hypothetical protein|nr:MAG TPA: YvrJ protein family protein [Caudoviricetes sp.]
MFGQVEGVVTMDLAGMGTFIQSLGFPVFACVIMRTIYL